MIPELTSLLPCFMLFLQESFHTMEVFSMEKKKLEAALSSPSATLELVEDTTLSHNECMIETEGGIFDCGLGTQMRELQKRLRLLAYEKRD